MQPASAEADQSGMTSEQMTRAGGVDDLSTAGMTSRANLLLATPTLVARALALFGCTWAPRLVEDQHDSVTSGIYAWVIAPRGATLYEALRAPAIYWGLGASVTGVAARLSNESRWVEARPLVGHGLAMARTGARPVVGPVVPEVGGRDAWKQVLDTVPERAVDAARPKLAAFAERLHTPGCTIGYAERFAIRAALCAGDVPAPVNSQYNGAWELPEDGATDLADVAAWYAVRHLAGGIRGWADEGGDPVGADGATAR
jgi:hypothetical protein